MRLRQGERMVLSIKTLLVELLAREAAEEMIGYDERDGLLYNGDRLIRSHCCSTFSRR